MKIYYKIFCIIVVFLFLFPSAICIKTVENQEKKSDSLKIVNTNSNEIFIQDDILLKRMHIPALQRAKMYIVDCEIRSIVDDIITHITYLGFADKNTFNSILSGYDTDITHVLGISSSWVNIRTSKLSDGGAYPFPDLLKTLVTHVSLGNFVYYEPTTHVQDGYGWNILMNGENLGRGVGRVFGFFGFSFNGVTGSGEDTKWLFSLGGYAILVLHSSEEGTR